MVHVSENIGLGSAQGFMSLISQIYKSRNVLLELMKSQNYNISDNEFFSINEINTMQINNQLDMILEKKKEEGKEEEKSRKVYIKYYLGKTRV